MKDEEARKKVSDLETAYLKLAGDLGVTQDRMDVVEYVADRGYEKRRNNPGSSSNSKKEEEAMKTILKELERIGLRIPPQSAKKTLATLFAQGDVKSYVSSTTSFNVATRVALGKSIREAWDSFFEDETKKREEKITFKKYRDMRARDKIEEYQEE